MHIGRGSYLTVNGSYAYVWEWRPAETVEQYIHEYDYWPRIESNGGYWAGTIRDGGLNGWDNDGKDLAGNAGWDLTPNDDR